MAVGWLDRVYLRQGQLLRVEEWWRNSPIWQLCAGLTSPIAPLSPPLPRAGESYKFGTKGLIAWAGLIVVLLGVGITLVISTSAIGQ